MHSARIRTLEKARLKGKSMHARCLPFVGFCATVFLFVGFSAGPVFAHHSFAAEYDSRAPLTLTGVVTRVEWTNPHAYIYIDVKDDAGRAVAWAVEGYPPNTLKRTGFPKDLLKAGDRVTITGWHARDSSNRVAGREITMDDGRKVVVGPQAAQ